MGAGAVGSVLGGLLSQYHDVTLIGRKGHIEAINSDGLRIEGSIDLKVRPVGRTDVERSVIQDLILITVKSHDAPVAYRTILPMVGPGSQMLIIQNGLEVLHSPYRIGSAPVQIGVVSLGASMAAPGRVRLVGFGKMTIGNREGRLGGATLIKNIFEEAGLDANVTKDIIGEVWRKTIVNAAINPLTALVGCNNGMILEDPGLRNISQDLFDEASLVSESLGILEPNLMSYEDVLRVIEDTSGNRSSMLQDIEAGRCTEIDSINGAICAISPYDEMVRTHKIVLGLVKAKERQVRIDGEGSVKMR